MSHGGECLRLSCWKKATTFVQIYIMSIRYRRDSAILKNAQKICFTRKWNFTTIFKKRIWVKTKLVPVLYIGWGKTSCFELDCIHKMETWKRFAILKNARKIVWPANENFTMFFKKHVFESWRCLFQEFILEKRQALLFESTLMSVGGDGTAAYLKTLEKKKIYPQMKILQRFSKNTCMSHGCFCSRLPYWKKASIFAQIYIMSIR